MSFYRCASPITFNDTLNSLSLRRVSSVKDLGVLLDVKLSFVLHYDYICSKAFRMLGFIKRNSKDFKDFMTLKALYFFFVRSIVEFCSIVWSPFYQVHVDRIEGIQRSFSRLALVRYGFDFHHLPSYQSRCKLLGLELLSNRRKIACVSFVHDVLSSNIDSSELLCLFSINVPLRRLRSHAFLSVPFHRTNYGCNEPLTNCMLLYNEVSDICDFNMSRESWRNSVKMSFYFSI